MSVSIVIRTRTATNLKTNALTSRNKGLLLKLHLKERDGALQNVFRCHAFITAVTTKTCISTPSFLGKYAYI